VGKQNISKKNKELIFKLLEVDLSINEVFKILRIPISHHWFERKNDIKYRKRIDELKGEKFYFTKYQFLSKYLINKRDLNKTKKEIKEFKKISNLLKNDDEFLHLFEKIKRTKHKISNKISSHSIPEDLKYHHSDKFNKSFYDIKNNLLFKYCTKCSGHYDLSHFHRNKSNSDGYSNYCIICTSNMNYGRDPHKRGELYKDKIIKKYNSVGNVIDRRCPKCKKFKSFKEFSHLYLGINVCNDCYEVRNNSNLIKKKVEFRYGKRVRVYDKNLKVLKKYCPKCDKMKKINEFHVDNNNKIDGRQSKCKICLRIYNNQRKTRS